MAITTYYPPRCGQNEYCKFCNTAQTTEDSCTSKTSDNSASTKKPVCSTYCDATVCNSTCDLAQTVCKFISGQYIKNHEDVGSYNGMTVTSGQHYIHEVWTADYWDTLISKINTAEKVGYESKQGSGGSVTPGLIGYPNPYTAQLYNDVQKKLTNFNGASYSAVDKDQLITAAVANAIGTAYNNAKFGSSVCDMCNADQSMHMGCGCNCNCMCSCNCGCNCPCTSPCTCSSNKTEDAGTTASANSVRSIWNY